MATNPITYRVSPEIDAEIKRLAKIHGGTDKALRIALGWSPMLGMSTNSTEAEKVSRDMQLLTASKAASIHSGWKPPLLKPSEKKK